MSLNSFRRIFKNKAVASVAMIFMGLMVLAMVVTTFSWSGLGKSNFNTAAASNSSDPDATVATVNGEKITRGEYEQSMDNMAKQMGSVSVMNLGYMHTMGFNQLVMGKELLARAAKMGVTVSDSDIAEARDKVITGQNWRKILSLSPKASLSDVDAALQSNGKSIEAMLPEADMRQSVTFNKLQDLIKRPIVVTEQDAKDSFKKYHTRHILIKNTGRSDEQAQAQARVILAKAQAPGADFAALAKQYSEDPGTKNKGGDDGQIDQSTPYVPEFKTAAFALQPGQVSPDLVKSPSFGYFIIKMEDIKDNTPPNFDTPNAEFTYNGAKTNKNKYIADLQAQKQNDAWSKFMQDVQNAPSKIDILDPGIRADKEMTDAQQKPMADPTQHDAAYRAVIADYQKAIKQSNSSQDTAVMYVQMANAYQQLRDIPAETTAYEEALKANGSVDTQLLMTLGDLYKQQKENDKALDMYQKASSAAWDDQGVHARLQTDFKDLNRKDLADAERAWVAQYVKAHPPTPPAGMQGQEIAVRNGKVISATPGGPIKVTPSAPPPGKTVQTIAVRNGKVISATPGGPIKVTPSGGKPTQ